MSMDCAQIGYLHTNLSSCYRISTILFFVIYQVLYEPTVCKELFHLYYTVLGLAYKESKPTRQLQQK